MGKYRKKPVVINAVQWLGDPDNNQNLSEIVELNPAMERKMEVFSNGNLNIETLEGVMTASPSDWIIRGVQGELYPCKPEIFESTYEPV